MVLNKNFRICIQNWICCTVHLCIFVDIKLWVKWRFNWTYTLMNSFYTLMSIPTLHSYMASHSLPLIFLSPSHTLSLIIFTWETDSDLLWITLSRSVLTDLIHNFDSDTSSGMAVLPDEVVQISTNMSAKIPHIGQFTIPRLSVSY